VLTDEKLRTNRGEIPKEEAFEIAHQIVGERHKGAEARRRAEGTIFHIPKTLLLVSGHLGAGKTTVTEALERIVPIVAIDKDAMSDIFSMSRKDDVHARTKQAAYDIMYSVADGHLADGRSVLLDAPFNQEGAFFWNPEWNRQMQGIAEKAGAKLKVIWCDASPETKLERMKARSSTRERDRTPEEVAALASRRDAPPIPFECLVLNTEEPNAEKLHAFLEAYPEAAVREPVPVS